MAALDHPRIAAVFTTVLPPVPASTVTVIINVALPPFAFGIVDAVVADNGEVMNALDAPVVGTPNLECSGILASIDDGDWNSRDRCDGNSRDR